MEETPRRRSRPKPPSGGSSLPFVPIIIGVIVIGFVIGAGLSVVGKHGSPDVAALATSSPQAEPSATATATAPARPRAPTPIPAAARTPKPSPLPSDTAAPSPSPSPDASPAQRPTSAAAVTQAPHVAQATNRPATQAPIAATTHAPVTPATIAPTVAPASAAPASVPTTVLDSDGEFSKLAGNVVLQYLLSIARGDTDSAYAALGDGPGSHAGSLPEVGTLDSTMHISKIEAHGSDSGATVTVDLTTASGPYYGQYTVHKSSTGAAIIVSHTFGKP
jgi:hypothetical protein